MSASALSNLRGYHWPEPVSWWPPAPGWWLLAVLLVALTALLIQRITQRRRRLTPARTALAELAALRATYDRRPDDAAFARGISQLLRRFALARFPRREVAGLAGKEWLAFLDAHGGNGAFCDGPGRALIEAPYGARATLRVESLMTLVAGWIEHNQEAHR
jgi:hypothetical protein